MRGLMLELSCPQSKVPSARAETMYVIPLARPTVPAMRVSLSKELGLAAQRRLVPEDVYCNHYRRESEGKLPDLSGDEGGDTPDNQSRDWLIRPRVRQAASNQKARNGEEVISGEVARASIRGA